MLLTKEERDKFIKYLEQCAGSDRVMLGQLEAINAPPALTLKVLKRMEAYVIVASDLSSIIEEKLEG